MIGRDGITRSKMLRSYPDFLLGNRLPNFPDVALTNTATAVCLAP
jgi:hypothetical protein